jgi:hypothetical protein
MAAAATARDFMSGEYLATGLPLGAELSGYKITPERHF